MEKVEKRTISVRKITRVGILGATAIVLSITPLGYIPINPVIQITLMHIPVIIAGMTEGVMGGAATGLIFGVSSLIRSISSPLAPVFLNPMVSVFPRILIGVISALVYKKTKNVPLTAAVGTFTNTVGVLSMIYIFAPMEFSKANGIPRDVLLKTLTTIALTNGVAEIIAAVLIITLIAKSLKKIFK